MNTVDNFKRWFEGKRQELSFCESISFTEKPDGTLFGTIVAGDSKFYFGVIAEEGRIALHMLDKAEENVWLNLDIPTENRLKNPPYRNDEDAFLLLLQIIKVYGQLD